MKYIVVPKTQDLPAEPFKVGCPLAINIFIMLPAVSFDDESALNAGKIRNAASD